MKTKSLSVFLTLLLALPLLAAEPPLIRNPLSTNSAVTVPLNLEVPQWNGTAWNFVAMSGGSGAPTTNLIVSLSSTNGYFIYTVTPGGNTNAFFVLTNTPGSTISGTINALIQNYYGLAADLDTNLFPVGMLAYPYDTGGLRIGDGATLGGIPISYRWWKGEFTNAPMQDSKAGQISILPTYTNHSDGLIYSELLLNSADSSNWFPIIAIHGTNSQSNLGLYGSPEQLPDFPVILLNLGNNGPGIVTENIGNSGGLFSPLINVVIGSGGNIAAGGSGGSGGAAGVNNPLIGFQLGNGGSASVSGAIAGNGGTAGLIQFKSGNGGNSAFNGFSGGNGGVYGVLHLNGANGGNATATANGANGGGGGVWTGDGAAGEFAGGGINTSAVGNKRVGGSITTFQTTFVSATLFTTTSTSGPTNTANETTLLGSLTSAPSGGSAVIKSNVLNHAGRTIRFKCSGYINTTLTPTLQLKFKLGSVAISDTTAVALLALTGTQPWNYEGEVTFRTVGGSGTCIGQSRFNYYTALGVPASFSVPVTATTTVDTTIDNTIDVTAQFSSAALNSLKCTAAYVEIIN